MGASAPTPLFLTLRSVEEGVLRSQSQEANTEEGSALLNFTRGEERVGNVRTPRWSPLSRSRHFAPPLIRIRIDHRCITNPSSFFSPSLLALPFVSFLRFSVLVVNLPLSLFYRHIGSSCGGRAHYGRCVAATHIAMAPPLSCRCSFPPF